MGTDHLGAGLRRAIPQGKLFVEIVLTKTHH
jgi:hypothetical protein